MKIGDFPVVEALMDARSLLGNLVDESDVTIDIGGRRMSADFVQWVRPSLGLELRRRIEDIDTQLRGYGVEIG